MWDHLFSRVLLRTPLFGFVTLEAAIEGNEVRFFAHSDKNLADYGDQLLPFIATPVDDVAAPVATKRCYVDFSQRENLILLREREMLRRGRKLFRVEYRVVKMLVGHFSVMDLFFIDDQGTTLRCTRRFFSPRHWLFAVDFHASIQYKKRKIPTYVKLQKVIPLLSGEPSDGLVEVLGFPYLSSKKYFPLLNFDYNRHTLIMGQTGTGKSKFIEFLLKDLRRRGVFEEYAVVVLDPHAALYTDCADIPGCTNVDFIRSSCRLFAQIGQPNVATELTVMLFRTLMKDQFNPKMERVLKYVLFVLFSIGQMSLENLKLFLTDVVRRKEILANSGLPPNILQFFETDYLEMETRFYELSIMPILTLLDELTFLPISNFQDSDTMQELIEKNSVLFLSLHQITLGQKATKLIAGLLIQQLFLLAQSRMLKKKILFVIDEVSVVQNDSLAAILSEARKFDLFLFLSQQYLQQVDEVIRNSILTNVYNYFLFRVSEDDARMLSNGLEFDFPESQLLVPHKESIGQRESHLKLKMITELNPRECLVRVYANGKFMPVFKARTIDINNAI